MAGDDDKTPEAAFKNVPQQPRRASGSGSAARRRQEERGGGPGRGGSSAPPPPAPSQDEDGPAVAPSAEEPEDAKNGGGGALGRLLRAWKPEDAKNGGGGGTPPAPSRTDEAAAAAASASSSRERPVDWAEKERIRKGKMPAANGSPPRRSAYDDDDACAGGGGKLMDDAILSHGGTAAACLKIKPRRPSKSKKRKDRGPPFWYGMGRDGQSTSTAGSDVDYSFDKIGVVSDGLRDALGRLGLAAAPERLYGRMMSGCDRNTHQARLQMSCKSWRAADHGEYPLCAFLTEAEKKKAHGKGLAMKAYDRRGQLYELNCRYLGSNKSYRLTSKWGDFLRKNDLVVKGVSNTKPGAKDVMLDLWLYRPPGGEVGMVMLHYRKGDAAHADAAFDEEDRRTRTRRQDDAAAEASSPPDPDDGGTGGNNDAVMEDAAGDANEKGQDDAGVKGEAAAAPSPSEPDGAAKAGEEQAGGAPSEVVTPLSPDADGTKTEEKEAGAAPMEAAAQSSSSEAGAAANKAVEKEAGAPPGEADGTKTEEKEAIAPAVDKLEAGEQGEEAAPPSPDAGDAKKDAGGAKVAALSLWFGLTRHEVLAAHALVLLSQGWL